MATVPSTAVTIIVQTALMILLLCTTVNCSAFDRRYFDQTHRKLVDGVMQQVKDFSLESIGLTKNWIEFGQPRTATTAQFMILNAFGWVLCGYNNVVSGFAQKHWLGTKMANATMYEGKMLSIAKTHRPSTITEAQLSGQLISYFTTSSRNGAIGPGNMGFIPPGLNVTFVQNFETMSEKGGLSKILDEYANLFHLSEAPVEVVRGVHEWLDLWDITRICCGAQMSKTWRALLYTVNPREGLKALRAGSHPCQEHNFTQIEQNLTAIEQPLYGEVLTKIGSCECSIDLTIQKKLQFNAPPYKPCQGPLDKLIEVDKV